MGRRLRQAVTRPRGQSRSGSNLHLRQHALPHNQFQERRTRSGHVIRPMVEVTPPEEDINIGELLHIGFFLSVHV